MEQRQQPTQDISCLTSLLIQGSTYQLERQT